MSSGYGHGSWPRKQAIAIVAEYWKKGATVGHVARKLGVSEPFVGGVYHHLNWMQSLRVDGSAGNKRQRQPQQRPHKL